MIIILKKNLSINEKNKNVIFEGYFGTDICQTNLAIVFLSLFILWECLLNLFHFIEIIIVTYKEIV